MLRQNICNTTTMPGLFGNDELNIKFRDKLAWSRFYNSVQNPTEYA